MDSVSTAFFEAIKKGDIETVSELLEAGVDIEMKGVDGDTPLIHAANYGRTSIMKVLLDYNANPNAKNNLGYSAFELMIEEKEREIIQLLIKKGANPNDPDMEDGFPIELIASSMPNDLETLQLLVEHGAKFENTAATLTRVKSSFGLSTLDVIYEVIRSNAKIDSKLKMIDAHYILGRVGNTLGLNQNIVITERSQEYKMASNGMMPKSALILLQEYVKQYQEKVQETPEQQYFKQIEQAFSNVIQLMDYSQNQFVNDAAKNLHSRFAQGELVYLPSGWNGYEPGTENIGHTLSIALQGKYLVYCNRGFKGDSENATKIYEIPDVEKITPELIQKCLYSYSGGPDGLKETLKSMGIELHNPLLRFPSKGQEQGNCTIANPRSAIEAMLLLCANQNKSKEELLNLASNTDRTLYKDFSRYTREKEIDFFIEKSHFATTPIMQEFYVKVVKSIINEHGGLNARAEDKRRDELLRGIKLLDNLAPEIKDKCQEQYVKLLVVAQAYGQKDIVDILTSKGISISLESDSDVTRELLLKAALSGKSEVVDVFMKKGVNPDLREKGSNATPLMYAAEYNYIDAVKILIKHGADVNAQDEFGKTALHYAAEYGQLDTVKFLIKKGANINAQDSQGTTPLMFAAEYGFDSVVKYLVKNNAEIKIENSYGYTAEKYASEYEHTSIANYLSTAQKQVKIEEQKTELGKENEVLMEKHNTFLPTKQEQESKKLIIKENVETSAPLISMKKNKPQQAL